MISGQLNNVRLKPMNGRMNGDSQYYRQESVEQAQDHLRVLSRRNSRFFKNFLTKNV